MFIRPAAYIPFGFELKPGEYAFSEKGNEFVKKATNDIVHSVFVGKNFLNLNEKELSILRSDLNRYGSFMKTTRTYPIIHYDLMPCEVQECYHSALLDTDDKIELWKELLSARNALKSVSNSTKIKSGLFWQKVRDPSIKQQNKNLERDIDQILSLHP